jgi:threonine synthase
VRALKVNGTFDDCQKLVKTAFVDKDLRKKFRLSSANSINISRLLPQAFYYTFSSLVVKNRIPLDSKIDDASIIAVVPSGNFGNLTSGLIAKKMGAPIAGFVAATNANHTVPDWIATGEYRTRPSVATLSNAMDVGAPSNYERISAMYSLEEVREIFASYWTDDEGTLDGIRQCKSKTGYTIDPYGAVAWKAWNEIRSGAMEKLLSGEKNDWTKPGLTPSAPVWAKSVAEKKAAAIILETAHPAKFGATVMQATGQEPGMPERLEKVLSLPDRAVKIEKDYDTFKEWLTSNL